MKARLPFDLRIPVLYVNPPLNADGRAIEEVRRQGGLGIVDAYLAPDKAIKVSEGIAYGVRCSLSAMKEVSGNPAVKLALLPFEEIDAVEALAEGALGGYSIPCVVEVGNARQAKAAERAGAAGLAARGNEGPGWVSETNGFVLLQEVLEASTLPVFLRGGVGIRTACGAIAAGAVGVVLDVHLLLTSDSSLPSTFKDFLGSLGPPATTLLAEASGAPCRVYARIGTRTVRELRKDEETLTDKDFPSHRDRISTLLSRPTETPDSDEALLPLSEDIVEAKRLAEEFGAVGRIVAQFGSQMLEAGRQWPFHENARIALEHGTRYPIVQGPMAHVSDNPDFLAAVLANGALPVIAMGNMPRPIAEEGIRLAREKTGGKFGVGLIGLDVNQPNYDAHLEIMSLNPPPFAVLAAGHVELARRIEQLGTKCYLHCPAPTIVSEALKAGLRHFVFEGCESGGHIGLLGSLDLWNANLREIDLAAKVGLALDEVSVLFAGGIGSARAAAFIAGMTADLTAGGLGVGFQMGTAYLTTEEAVSTGAITSLYRKLTLESERTTVIGRTVNIKARGANSAMARRLFDLEHERVRQSLPLRDRKLLYEKDNLGALRLASKGCAIEPETASSDCPAFYDLTPDEQLDRGLYLMGQVVAVLNATTTMEKLHETIVSQGRSVFERRPTFAPEETTAAMVREEPPLALEMDREPIAVVGIGLMLPGSDSPESFWEQITQGRSGIVEVPAERWGNPDYYYDSDPKAPDKTYSRIGGFITNLAFDPIAYRIPPAVAQKMDRTQRMAVAATAKAIEDAGLTPGDLRGKKVGIIIGNSMGGEMTDLYATRIGLPRTLDCLGRCFEGVDLDEQAKRSLLESFRSTYLEGLPQLTEDSLPGELANVISGRVANVFNLEGQNFTVDAACASSIAAVMNATSALRSGAIDVAVSGGVDGAMHPSSFIKFCKVGALSPDGSRPFDEGANGFVMGEGVGMMILKRLSDAVRDNDRIYATILEFGSSSDGRGKGITAPNAAGQVRALDACYERAGVSPESVDLVEAHGTSTAVGDKTELKVLDEFFRKAGSGSQSVGIGSVKSQIGHLKAAAGAAGMIKAALSLFHKTLPPTINIRKPSSAIDWTVSPLFLLTESRSWDTSTARPRRAGVSAFGFGGTNFHVLLQEHVPGLRVVSARKSVAAPARVEAPDWPVPPDMNLSGEAWVVGGADQADLRRRIETILGELNPENFMRVAVEHRDKAGESAIRCGFAARNVEEALIKLKLIREGIDDPKKRIAFGPKGVSFSDASGLRSRAGIAFLFPGQGSQYPFMLRDLAQRFPIVAETFREADEILTGLGVGALTPIVFPKDGGLGGENSGDALKETQTLQPMILTANIAISRILEQFGIHPSACAGHSLGEYAACVAAGVFSFRDALEAVAVRGREMARVSIADPGLMMSVPADARLVEEALAQVDGYAVAANKNSPKQTVISGETEAVKQAGELFKARGMEVIILPVSAAFHSGVVAPAREPFMKTLRKIQLNSPSVPVISNVTGDFYPIGPAAPDKIRDLLGKQFAAPVEWVKTVRRLYNDGIRIFVECGPKRVLTNLAIDTLPADALAAPTNHPKKGGIMQLLETLAALAVEGAAVYFDESGRAAEKPSRIEPRRLTVVRKPFSGATTSAPPPIRETAHTPNPLDPLMDDELREMASDADFAGFLAMQSEPVRCLLKSGYRTYVQNVLPLERTVSIVESEGMSFRPVVVTGISAGLPSDVRFPFDVENLDDLILGRNYIKKVPDDGLSLMLEKNIERLFKGPSGEAELRLVDDVSGVIKLAGFFTEENVAADYGVDERLFSTMDITTRLAVAAGLEALRDAGIPLVQQTKITSAGTMLPDSWALPEPMRRETGVIFASAFPGLASLVDEVTREAAGRYGAGARKRLIAFYSGMLNRVGDDREREEITRWFTEEFGRLNTGETDELYTFNRNFLLRVMVMAHGQFAQFIKAQGPNTHVDAACAGTTQAVLLARDWIRTGQAKRVVVIAADDVAGRTLLPWVGSGFLAMGAATVEGKVSEAALPFDDRRHGLILGSAAVGLIIERQDIAEERGIEPTASIEAGVTANSAYHGTRLDVDHIAAVMEQVVSRWEKQTGKTRDELARDLVFMSHETYSPKRGGSSAAEIQALRRTFGDAARMIPITNTKGFTGHTMGVGVEDAVALRCLQKGMLPPIPNLRQPDPEFADMNLSKGGPCSANHVLRLAAGFGSQIVVALYKAISRQENRLVDLAVHRDWLRRMTGLKDPVVSVEHRTLRVAERPGTAAPAVAEGPLPSSSPPSSNGEITGPERIASGQAAEVRSARGSVDEVRAKILALLSDKTGYPSEMLDTGLDLEADLGIDTVKQAEFISEVRETFDIPRIDGLKIADFPTIEHIIGFVMDRTSQRAAAEDSELGASLDRPTGEGEQVVRAKVLGLLSEKTGYPVDMLDTGLDLEADLGIDTVKQAEFISEVREAFDIPRIDGLKIADFPTIEHIIGFVMERRTVAAELKPEKIAQPESLSSAEDLTGEIGLFETRVVPVKASGVADVPAVSCALIFGGPDPIAENVQIALAELGYDSIRRSREPRIPDDLKTAALGIINLFPMVQDGLGLKRSLELYLSCATTFENGPQFLVTAVSEDGAFGFHEPADTGYIAGGVSGATKAFAREYPSTRVRALDLHPSLGPEQSAAAIRRGVVEELPTEVGVAADGAMVCIRLLPTALSAEEPDIRPDDVVLVTGGARGITAACLRRLAEERRLTLVLFGRTNPSAKAEKLADASPEVWAQEKARIIERLKRQGAKFTPMAVERELSGLQSEAEVFRTLRELRALGSEVIYRSVDIRDKAAVDNAIAETTRLCGTVDIVVHAAGIDVSRALRGKTLEQMEAVIAVKVDGMLNLLDALRKHDAPPRRIVGFGSVSGRFGNLAQVDYSAANDALAHLLRRAERDLDAKVSIIDWAPWSEIGMAVRGSVQQSLEAAGIDFIPPKVGTNLFEMDLGRTGGSCEVVAAGRMGPFTVDAFGITDDRVGAEVVLAGQRARIVSEIPGEYLKASVMLDPSHPILDHHRIDRAAVFPGVGAMEVMRSATALLDPAAREASFENVRFHGALKVFKSDPIEAFVETTRKETGPGGETVYAARIFSWFTDPKGRRVGAERLHHEGLICVRPKLPSVIHETPAWNRYSLVGERDIYEVFFHGPAFQYLDRLQFDSDRKRVKFVFKSTPETPDMFTDATPAVMEAVFQTAAGYGVESLGITSLPTGADRVDFRTAEGRPAGGELLLVKEGSSEKAGGRRSLTFDGVVTDAFDRVMLSFKGVEMMELKGHPPFPGMIYEEIVSVDEVEKDIEARSDTFIGRLLTDEEKSELAQKKFPKRAGEWIAGRVAAKRAVLNAIAGSRGLDESASAVDSSAAPTGSTIQIVADEHRKPTAELTDRPGKQVAAVSITHSNGLAMAAASTSTAFVGLGVDAEKVEERSEAWISDYFTPEEAALAARSGDKWRMLTTFWALKEAALKAIGTGLAFDMRDVGVSSLKPFGYSTLEFKNEAADYLEKTLAGSIEARAEDRNGMVIARVTIR